MAEKEISEDTDRGENRKMTLEVRFSSAPDEDITVNFAVDENSSSATAFPGADADFKILLPGRWNLPRVWLCSR
ncbi:MAG: hypothetical protein U5L04_05705 [Trueperaceae bacterium]|nr:hypothetical protein [Trueperaceae bacterium]